MNKITIRDVAKAADVSIATVSKALNGVDVVHPATKKRVQEAAEKLHYVPNLMGKQLKSGKTNMLGFYTSSVAGPYFSQLIEAVAKATTERNYGLNVLVSQDKQIILNNIMGNVVDGIIGFEELITEEELKIIKKEKMKAIFIDRNIADETIGSVVFDSYHMGYEATKYLIQLGHKEIVYLKGFDDVFDSDERLRGYLDALQTLGLHFQLDWIIPGKFEEETAKIEVQKFIKKKLTQKQALPTAFLAGNDLSAIGTIKAIEALGYHVPADFSVMGFDDISIIPYMSPQLTTVHNPIIQQGEEAVAQLIDLINGTKQGTSVELKGKLIVRETTGKPRTKSE